MDPIEKKVSELYRQKKREDEKLIPGFDAFLNKPERVQHVKHSYFLLKVAASVVLLLSAGIYYFYSSRRTVKETVQIYPVNIDQNLPTQSLLDKNAGTVYIWNWKAPTDQLLKDAAKSLKTPIKI
jgi:hypothetical protein